MKVGTYYALIFPQFLHFLRLEHVMFTKYKLWLYPKIFSSFELVKHIIYDFLLNVKFFDEL
jgi:hypothetical protein